MKDYMELFKEVLMIMMSIKEVYNVIDTLCLNSRSSPDQLSDVFIFMSCISGYTRVQTGDGLMLDAITGPTEWSFANALVMILL